MNRAEVLQEVRLMKFEDVYSRRSAGRLTQEQAAEIPGVSVRTVRRWEDRFEADGAEGLYDRRLGKLANTGNRPLRGGDDERYKGSNRYGDGDVDLVRQQIPGLFAQAFPREACHPARVYPELQLGTPHITEPWPDPVRASTRSPSAQTAPPSDGRHDAAPGWLHASMAP